MLGVGTLATGPQGETDHRPLCRLLLHCAPCPLHRACISFTRFSMHSLGLALYFLSYLILFLLHRKACGIFVSRSGVEHRLSAVEVWSPNHWATREVRSLSALKTNGNLSLGEYALYEEQRTRNPGCWGPTLCPG